MSVAYLDTDIIIRLLTGDDSVKQVGALRLFERIERGEVTVAAPVTVVADAVFVLSSPRLYHLPRHEIAALLTALVRLPGFTVRDRRSVLSALQLYGATPSLDFGDALIAASMQQSASSTVYSYDTDFDRVPGIDRVEP